MDTTPAPEVEIVLPEENTWAMWCHLSALFAFLGHIVFLVFTLGISRHMLAFAFMLFLWLVWSVAGPLTVWLWKRKASRAVDAHGREAVNFQFTMGLYTVVAVLLCFVVIGFFILPVLWLINFILVITSGMKAKSGLPVHYPFTWRIMK